MTKAAKFFNALRPRFDIDFSNGFPVFFITADNFIKRSRRIVHIRHHATDIDEITAWCPVTGRVCFYHLPKVQKILIFKCLVNMPVKIYAVGSQPARKNGIG